MIENRAKHRSHSLRKKMGYVSGFIATVYARFSISALAILRTTKIRAAVPNADCQIDDLPFRSRIARSRRRITCSRPAQRHELQVMRPGSAYNRTVVNGYRLEEAEAISGSISASGFTMSSANLFRSSFASASSSNVDCRSSADLSFPSSCANVRTLP